MSGGPGVERPTLPELFAFLFWPWLLPVALLAWPVQALRRPAPVGEGGAAGRRAGWPLAVLRAPVALAAAGIGSRRGKLVAAVALLSVFFVAVVAGLALPVPAWEPGRGVTTAEPPSLRHPLGTNGDGVDMAALVAHGCRNTYLVATVALLVVLAGGVPLGVLLERPRWSRPLRAALGALETVPLLVGMMIVAGFAALWIGALTERGLLAVRWHPVVRSLVVGGGIGIWLAPSVARLVAERVGSFRRRDFIAAALVTGVPERRVVWDHIIRRNALSEILILTTHLAGMAVLFEASLGYLFSIGTAKLGRGLYYSLAQLLTTPEARQAVLFLDRWWLFAVPMAFIAAAILGLLLAGDAMADLAARPAPRRPDHASA